MGNEYVVFTYEVSELKIKPYGMEDEVVGPPSSEDYQGETTNYLVNWEQNNGSWTITNREKPGLDIVISKTDVSGEAIAGAVFELDKKAGDVYARVTHSDYDWLDENDQFTVPEEGFQLTGLKDGMYQIREVSPPSGYVITNKTPVTFEIEHGAVVAASNVLAVGVTYNPASEPEASEPEKDTFIIPNTPGAALPNTGGPGTNLIYLFGLMLMGLAGAGLMMRRRRREAA